MSITVALLQALSGALLIVLFFAVLLGGLLLAAVLGRTTGGRGGTIRPPGEPERSLFPGRTLCATGLALAALGGYFVDLSTNVLGMILGMTGYYLGARAFGVVVIVLSTVTLILGLLIGQGAIPGSYDDLVNGYVPRH